MFETIGPVWDGNEVWLVDRRRRDLRRLPGLVRDDVLRLLPRAAARARLPDHPRRLVRVARARATSPRWRTAWLWANAVGSFGASLIWGVGLVEPPPRRPARLERRLHRHLLGPLQPRTPCSAASRSCCSSPSTARRFLTLRTTGDLCERAAAPLARALASPAVARRRGLPVVDGRRRGRPQRQGRLPADPAGRARRSRRSSLAVLFVLRRRSGWAFAMTALGSGARRSPRSSPASTRG